MFKPTTNSDISYSSNNEMEEKLNENVDAHDAQMYDFNLHLVDKV